MAVLNLNQFILLANCAIIQAWWSMRSFKRILPFIILNVIISAATTLAVLYWWDKTQRPVLPDPRLFANTTPQVMTTNSPSQTGSPTSQVTLTAENASVIQIQNVFGVGDINNEVVQLKRTGSGDLVVDRLAIKRSKWTLIRFLNYF